MSPDELSASCEAEPYWLFLSQTSRLSRRLRLPMTFISEALGTLESAFGREWLRNAVSEKVRPAESPLPWSKHPLGGCFAVAGEPQIVEVLEVAAYLRHLAQVPGIEAVIKNMRESYDAGLLQLAFAYRFQRVGARKLILEPATLDGRVADIGFNLMGHPYCVECYIPDCSEPDSSRELDFLLTPIIEAIKGAPVLICIRLKAPIDAADRKRIGHAIVQSVRSATLPTTIDDAAASISVELVDSTLAKVLERGLDPSSPSPISTAHRFFALGRAFEDDLDLVRLGKAIEGKSRGWVAIWQAPSEDVFPELQAEVEQLAKKAGRKFAQTHCENGARRLVIIGLPEAEMQDDRQRALLLRLQQAVVPEHAAVAGLLVAHRTWWHDCRYRYATAYLAGGRDHAIPDEIFESLKRHESDADVLANWHMTPGKALG